MWLEQPQQINPQLVVLGTAEIPLFLLIGERCALIEGGTKVIAPLVQLQIIRQGVAPEELMAQIITHTHYDHTGLAPYFRRTFPNLKIYASRAAARNLSNPKLLAYIDRVNDQMLARYGLVGKLGVCEAPITDFRVDVEIDSQDTIELGGLTLEVIMAPGHTDDGVAIYARELEALFISDFGGLKISDESVFPTPFFDLEQYLATLEELRGYRPKILGLGHFGVATDQEVDRFFEISLRDTKNFVHAVSESMKTDTDSARFSEIFMEKNYRGRVCLIPEQVMKKTVATMAQRIFRRSRPGG